MPNWSDNPWDIGAPPSGDNPNSTPAPESQGNSEANLGSMLMVLGLMQQNAANMKELRANRETALLKNAEQLQIQLQRNYDLLQQQHNQALDKLEWETKFPQMDWVTGVNRWDNNMPPIKKTNQPISNLLPKPCEELRKKLPDYKYKWYSEVGRSLYFAAKSLKRYIYSMKNHA